MSREKELPREHAPGALERLQKTIGYAFRDASLLKTAMTHSSFQNEHRQSGARDCNERMEFLGDSVLSLVAGEYLYAAFPERSEGELSVLRARAVCTEALSGYAASISLGNCLLLGHGEERSGGRTKPRILENSFEALVGAIYLDGGLEPARSFVLPFLTEKTRQSLLEKEFRDYKTLLQQIVQQDGEERLEYVLTGEAGPAHDRVFTVEARLNSNIIGRGEGHSKRAAEQEAAKKALALFGEKDL